jgi:RNA polymerase sigma factor (sigma-70 family)
VNSKIPPDVARAIELLYQQHADALLERAFKLTRSHTHAEDAVHDTFYDAALHWTTSDLPTRTDKGRRRWLFVVVKHKCIDQYRASRFTVGLPDYDIAQCDHDPAEEALLNLAWQKCEKLILGMPEKQYQVLVLFLQGWSHARIASHLAIASSTARSHLSIARNMLRTAVGTHVPFLGCIAQSSAASVDKGGNS